uniref:Uncharacterized protein n=1 Tax=Globisporangium ultimum (strain ATCC 200006 / CBS 805.95 / DAOM BR144) TaxID=431595 RepID=K3WJI8_GLOUD
MAEMDAIGGKRKYKENAFTAKAESGTLKVKILRKDLRNGAVPAVDSGSARSGFLATTSHSIQQQPTQQQQEDQQPLSPPKPRPNRKHVPIFYQRQTVSIDAANSSTSSTDDAMSGMQSMSTTSADYSSNDHSTSPTSSAAATSQDGSRFSTLLSGLRLENGNDTAFPRLSAPPVSNPLFTRSDSDGTSTFGDILRHSFPSAQGPAPPPPQLGSFSSLHGLQGGPAVSALHQLASSSSSFGSSLASLSSAARDLSSPPGSTEGYRFNPFTALQSAIDVHQAAIGGSTAPSTSFINHQQTHAPYQYPHERQHSHHPHQQQAAAHRAALYSQQADAEADDAMDDGDDGNSDLGPPPGAPPAFTIQNSLMGGGIEMQPVIANVNTHNFDWSSGTTGRPRSGSLPNILEAGHAAQSNGSSGNASSGASNSTTTASNVHMWKEV